MTKIPFAEDRKGWRVSASGLLANVRDELKRGPHRAYYKQGLHDLERHLHELAQRFYAGDLHVVDEFLQLYTLDEAGGRKAAREADTGEDRVEWTRGALYAFALAVREGSPHLAEEGLGAMGISTRAELEGTGLDEYDLSPLRKLLWRKGDRPEPPIPDATMTAHHDGEGWILSWADADGDPVAGLPNDGLIEWPFGDDFLEGDDLESLGFDVV